ncbi:MAG: DNA repair protein RecN [Polaromonas sp.]|nr:DNA repair protein RecN [Polaromonas sp.]
MSLLRIALKDFVIVTQLELDFAPGFTVLTGETGAGKSILIDALQLALGGRADAAVVRSGQARAEVSVEFETTPAVRDWLGAADLDPTEPTLLLRRTVDAAGRSKGWINGSPATATQLRELGGWLLDIHGQHAWQGLMKPDTTRALLDEYAGADTAALQPLWQAWRQAEQALAQAQANAAQAEQTRERLQWQLAELDKLAPTETEWPQLQEEHARLANVHALLEGAQAAADALSDADTNADSLLARASQQLTQRQHLEPRFTALLATLEQASVLVTEASRDLHNYLRHTEADPVRLTELDQRMATWLSLAKRHHCSPQDLPKCHADCQAQLAALAAATDVQALASTASRCQDAFLKKSEQISAMRHEYKGKLAINITNIMQQLGMAGGVFDVQLTRLDAPQASGLESVEFLVAGHAGTEPRPIMKVASGGELSRIALAIAVTTSQLGGCPTLIFDEVDSGVGGSVAHTVGQLMAQLGQHRQVLAITHLPQVAACASHHVKVAKAANQGEVVSQVTTLTPGERELEIARMLGGSGITDASLNHAREMLTS